MENILPEISLSGAVCAVWAEVLNNQNHPSLSNKIAPVTCLFGEAFRAARPIPQIEYAVF
eukprot:862422-Pelagomonas_calceolata.AAC.1